MNDQVIKNFVDNKIRISLYEKKNVSEVIMMLHDRVIRYDLKIKEDSSKSKYWLTHNKFALQRISDFRYMSSKFQKYPPIKVFNLIKLKEKILGDDIIENMIALNQA